MIASKPISMDIKILSRAFITSIWQTTIEVRHAYREDNGDCDCKVLQYVVSILNDSAAHQPAKHLHNGTIRAVCLTILSQYPNKLVLLRCSILLQFTMAVFRGNI